MRQLDDGIGDTLVLALKVLGDGRSPVPLNVDSTSVPPTLPSLQTGTVPGSTSYRDMETDSGVLHFTRPNTKVSPIPTSN
jgi:hypothetical protein